MKRAISILSLVAVLSLVPIDASASGGTCSVPSCRPKPSLLPTPTDTAVLFRILLRMGFPYLP